MALKFVNAADPIEVKNLVLELHTPPGIGKTSTGFTSSRPAVFAFDKGVYRSKHRRGKLIIPATWGEVGDVAESDLADCDTVVLDTVGMALDLLAAHLISDDSKNGNRKGGLSIQGYGALKTAFAGWLGRLRNMGKDVVLLSHMTEEKKGDDFVERLDIQGGTKNEIYKVADCMGRIFLKGNKRVLSFDPSETSFGKNPAQLGLIDVPDFAKEPNFLAQVIVQVKEGINALTADQKAVAEAMSEWQEKISKLESPDHFNDFLGTAKEAPIHLKENIKRVLVKAAKDKKVKFDSKAGAFVAEAA
jgi:hypothetical protein